MRKRKRLIWRLFPSFLVLTLLSLIAVSWYATSSLRTFYIDHTAADLKARAHLVEEQIRQYLSPPEPAIVDAFCKEAGKLAATRITVILPSGEVIGDSREEPRHMDNHADRPEIKSALSGQKATSIRTSSTLVTNSRPPARNSAKPMRAARRFRRVQTLRRCNVPNRRYGAISNRPTARCRMNMLR